jgi:hypothetical protein
MKRVEHVVNSRVVYPTLPIDQFFRGWINIEEMPAFIGSIEHASTLKCPNFCEIGVKHAGSSLCITQALNKLKRDSRLFCIDVDENAGTHFKANVPQTGTCKGQFIHGCSWKVSDKVPDQLSWLFIDGCHCLECTLSDIKAFCPKVVKDGLVIFHDCDYRVQLRRPTQRCSGTRKRVGVYKAMFSSQIVQEQFYMIHMVEGAIDPKNLYWNGLAVFKKKG